MERRLGRPISAPTSLLLLFFCFVSSLSSRVARLFRTRYRGQRYGSLTPIREESTHTHTRRRFRSTTVGAAIWSPRRRPLFSSAKPQRTTVAAGAIDRRRNRGGPSGASSAVAKCRRRRCGTGRRPAASAAWAGGPATPWNSCSGATRHAAAAGRCRPASDPTVP